MKRFSIDSMIFDKIAGRDETIALVCRLVASGTIQLVATHIQRDEHAGIADPALRHRIARIPVSDVPTLGFVAGLSRAGMARVSSAGPYDAMTGQNRRKYAADALIAMTAQFEGTILVTEDRRLRNRAARELGVETWDWSQFHAHLESLYEAFVAHEL